MVLGSQQPAHTPPLPTRAKPAGTPGAALNLSNQGAWEGAWESVANAPLYACARTDSGTLGSHQPTCRLPAARPAPDHQKLKDAFKAAFDAAICGVLEEETHQHPAPTQGEQGQPVFDPEQIAPSSVGQRHAWEPRTPWGHAWQPRTQWEEDARAAYMRGYARGYNLEAAYPPESTLWMQDQPARGGQHAFLRPTNANTLQQARDAAHHQLQHRLPPTQTPGQPARGGRQAVPKASHSRSERQQQRWTFRSAQAQARKTSADRKAANKARRRRREAYLHFNPDANTPEDEHAANANRSASATEGSILYVPTSPE